MSSMSFPHVFCAKVYPKGHETSVGPVSPGNPEHLKEQAHPWDPAPQPADQREILHALLILTLNMEPTVPPWCWNILAYIYPQNGPNVGKYSSTMEHLGVEEDCAT